MCVACESDVPGDAHSGLEHDVGAPLGTGAAASRVVLVQQAVADGQGGVLVAVVDQHLQQHQSHTQYMKISFTTSTRKEHTCPAEPHHWPEEEAVQP